MKTSDHESDRGCVMDISEAIEARRSVRRFRADILPREAAARLRREIDACNEQGRLSVRLVTGEPKAFGGPVSRAAGFRNARNYLVLCGRPEVDLEVRCGYWGEHLVLFAKTLGIDACWVGGSVNRRVAAKSCAKGERYVCAIALGIGDEPGTIHKRKAFDDVIDADRSRILPDWFIRGVNAALLAPPAMTARSTCLRRAFPPIRRPAADTLPSAAVMPLRSAAAQPIRSMRSPWRDPAALRLRL